MGTGDDVAGSNGERSNPDLFRELRGLLSKAPFENYYKNGIWERETLLVDIELLRVHRREAGAPEATPASDVPELDRLERHSRGKLTPTQPSAPPPRALVADARKDESNEVRDFVDKWRLERRVKDLLLSLRLPLRQRVMRSYRHTSQSMSPTAQLELLIRDMERTVSARPTSAGGSGRAPGQRAPASPPRGVKRPVLGSTRRSVSRPRPREPERFGSRPTAPRTPSRSPARGGPTLRGTVARAPSRAPVSNGARNGADGIKRARTGEGPRPSAVPSSKASAGMAAPKPKTAAAPQPAEAKKAPKLETKPGDLIKNLLF